jgi:hypothetical protein
MAVGLINVSPFILSWSHDCREMKIDCLNSRDSLVFRLANDAESQS